MKNLSVLLATAAALTSAGCDCTDKLADRYEALQLELLMPSEPGPFLLEIESGQDVLSLPFDMTDEGPTCGPCYVAGGHLSAAIEELDPSGQLTVNVLELVVPPPAPQITTVRLVHRLAPDDVLVEERYEPPYEIEGCPGSFLHASKTIDARMIPPR